MRTWQYVPSPAPLPVVRPPNQHWFRQNRRRKTAATAVRRLSLRWGPGHSYRHHLPGTRRPLARRRTRRPVAASASSRRRKKPPEAQIRTGHIIGLASDAHRRDVEHSTRRAGGLVKDKRGAGNGSKVMPTFPYTANEARETAEDADDEANQAAVVLALEVAGEQCARQAELVDAGD